MDFDKIEEMPLYKKGEEILDVVETIVGLIPEENVTLRDFATDMMNNAYMLTVKLVGAESGGLYSIKMANAAIMRQAAMDLFISYHSLKMFGFDHAEYFIMVRVMIEEYRKLFIDWVDTFDKDDYFIDKWNLFNPPGIRYNGEYDEEDMRAARLESDGGGWEDFDEDFDEEDWDDEE